MKAKNIKILMLVAGILLFDLLFWDHLLGINVLLFTGLLLIYAIATDPHSLKNRKTLVTALGALAAAILVVTHNSTLAYAALFVSFIIFTGFHFQPQLRSPAAAIPTGFFNFASAPFAGLKRIPQLNHVSSKTTAVWNVVRLFLIPFVICFIFYWIYKVANPAFDNLSNTFFQGIADYFAGFFQKFSLGRCMFILFGMVIITGILVNTNFGRFMLWENRSQDELEHNPVESPETTSQRLVSLSDEYKISLILLALINALILIVNLVDINWLWFGYEFKDAAALSQLVHNGTYLLIISILMSIGIMVFIFRGSMNYTEKSKLLRWLSYAWIFQNTVMAISVAVRNYHYMHYYGLAYKRIGVFVFLVLTLFGLATLIIKIQKRKSLYFLFRTFSWAAYAMMIFISFFNWDLIIAKHNTTHQSLENRDLGFLFSLSDKTLHIIAQHDEILDRSPKSSFYPSISAEREIFNERVKHFMERKKNESWQEWNYPEQITYNYFLTHKLKEHEQSHFPID